MGGWSVTKATWAQGAGGAGLFESVRQSDEVGPHRQGSLAELARRGNRWGAARVKMSGPPVPKPATEQHAEDAAPTGPKATTVRYQGLLPAFVERQVDDFERLCLTSQVDIQGGANSGELNVHVGHGNGVPQGG